MVLYNDNGKPNVKQIEECALRTMATNMLQLVYTYLEEVSIDNKETHDAIVKLKEIGHSIMDSRYDDLINDESLIDKTEKEPTGSNFYLDMTK